MYKKIILLVLISLLIFPLEGCWNYRGLDDMTIVVGIAIDKDPLNGNYLISYETIDQTSPSKEKGLSAKIIEADGKTLFDAARNAKMRSNNKLYFGHLQIVIISQEIARSEGIGDMIDWFLRDGECRETICFAISQEKTAREIFSVEGESRTVVSTNLHKILDFDNKITSSTLHVKLYEIFSTLKAEGKSLVLPAIHNVKNDGEPTAEVNGLAVFKDKKLVGYLTPDESKCYLFIENKIKGGVLTLTSAGDGRSNGTLEIYKSKTKRSFKYTAGRVKFLIQTDTTVYLNEFMGSIDALDERKITALEKSAQAELKYKILAMIQRVQTDYGSDIFGFGSMIYKKDNRLWKRLKDTWEEQFQSLEVEVETNIHIVNTASIKKS